MEEKRGGGVAEGKAEEGILRDEPVERCWVPRPTGHSLRHISEQQGNWFSWMKWLR